MTLSAESIIGISRQKTANMNCRLACGRPDCHSRLVCPNALGLRDPSVAMLLRDDNGVCGQADGRVKEGSSHAIVCHSEPDLSRAAALGDQHLPRVR